MSQMKILNKKFEKLNELKGLLVSRSEDVKEDVVKEIKEVIEDIELVLEDFGYISGDTEVEGGNRELKQLTLEDLLKYNGQNGMPAYVEVEGNIYDVTDNPYWKNGKHFGVSSGEAVTNTFYACHARNPEVLKKLKIVGVLTE